MPIPQNPLAGSQRYHCDWQVGQRVSEKGCHERGQNIATHEFRDKKSDDEVQTVKRGKGGEHACKNPTRYAFRRIGQPVQPVLDILDGARPAAARVQGFPNDPPNRSAIAPSENHLIQPLFVPFASDQIEILMQVPSTIWIAQSPDLCNIAFRLKRCYDAM